MNLNKNPRIEDFEISDDIELTNYLIRFADELFSDQSRILFTRKNEAIRDIKAFDDEKQEDEIQQISQPHEIKASFASQQLDIKMKKEIAELEILNERAKQEKIKRQQL